MPSDQPVTTDCPNTVGPAWPVIDSSASMGRVCDHFALPVSRSSATMRPSIAVTNTVAPGCPTVP